MAIDLYIWPDCSDSASRINHKSCPLDAHVGLTIHGLFYPYAKLFTDISIIIRAEMTFKVMFGAKFGLFLPGVLRNADYFGIGGGKIFDKIGKLE